MNPSERSPIQIGLWAMLLLGIFAWAPATYPGYWQSIEGFLPIYNASSNSGIVDIGVEADLWRGTGRGAYLLVRPLVQLGLSATAAVRINFVLALVVGGLGTYSWLRPRLGDRTAALAGLTYMLMPPLLATVYVRGSLSDALVMALFPLLMAGLQMYVLERSPAAIGVIVLSQLLLWRIQPGLTVFVTLFALAFIIVVERDWWLVLTLVISAVAGITSLIPLWSVQSTSAVNFGEHFVYLYQLFGNQWDVAPSIPGWQDGYPFQLGIFVIGMGIFSLWSWWQLNERTAELNRFLWFMIAATLLLTTLSLGISAPLWELSRAGRLLTYPWQILLIASLPLVVLASMLTALQPVLQKSVYWVSLLILVTLSSHSFLTTRFTSYSPSTLRPLHLRRHFEPGDVRHFPSCSNQKYRSTHQG